MLKNIWNALCIALFAFAMSVNAEPLVQRPEVKIGDSWSYQTVDDWNGAVKDKYALEVSAVSSKEIRLSRKSETTGASMNITQTPDLNFVAGASATDGAPTQYSPDNGTYAFPLEIGKTWKPEVKFTRSNRYGSFQLSTIVVGWEKVKVRAGEFLALKITQDGYYTSTTNQGTGTGRMQSTLWYVPAVKAMVKFQYQDTWRASTYNKVTIELTGYQIN